MRAKGWAAMMLALCVPLVAGCGGPREPRLMNLRAAGPDEFAILPTKPLQAPPDFSTLPPPTPGGSNITDPTPDADAVTALGGSAAALTRGGIDGGIVTYASRMGVQPDIRQSLAASDLEHRRRHTGRPLERLFGVTVYYRAYRSQSLDQHLELERLRRAGVKTPSAPPDPELE